MRALSIGKLAKAAQVSVDTIRFYEKSGLLAPGSRRPSGFREYTEQDLRQLLFIRRARHLGFSIDEIGELLGLNGEQDGGRLSAVIERKRAAVDARIEELHGWHDALTELMQLGGRADRTTILDSFERCVRDAGRALVVEDSAPR